MAPAWSGGREEGRKGGREEGGLVIEYEGLDMIKKGVGRRAALTVMVRRRAGTRQSLGREKIMVLVVVCACERVSGAEFWSRIPMTHLFASVIFCEHREKKLGGDASLSDRFLPFSSINDH